VRIYTTAPMEDARDAREDVLADPHVCGTRTPDRRGLARTGIDGRRRDIGQPHDVVEMDMRQEHSGEFDPIGFDPFACGGAHVQAIGRHGRFHQCAHLVVACGIAESGLDARVHDERSEARVVQRVEVELDRFLAVFDSGRTRGGVIEIDHAAAGHRPIGRDDLLELDRTGHADQSEHGVAGGSRPEFGGFDRVMAGRTAEREREHDRCEKRRGRNGTHENLREPVAAFSVKRAPVGLGAQSSIFSRITIP